MFFTSFKQPGKSTQLRHLFTPIKIAHLVMTRLTMCQMAPNLFLALDFFFHQIFSTYL